MIFSEERKKQIETEFKFTATRSSGPGGQNVNKVNTRVELRFSVVESAFLSEEEKQKILLKLKNRINTLGEFILVSSVERSQWRNRERASEKFFELIEKALSPVKKRIKSKPSLSSRLKRLESKKFIAQKKKLRKSPDF